MTAVVGILNRQAAVIAADSAVTIAGGRGRKIFNRANKIFRVSNNHPIGVMLYHSASFLHTPWEVILKMYREYLADRSLPKLADYEADFLGFLKQEKFFANEQAKQKALRDFALGTLDLLNKEALKDTPPKPEILINPDEQLGKIVAKIKEIEQRLRTVPPTCCPELEDCTYEDFFSFGQKAIDEAIERTYRERFLLGEDDKERLRHILYETTKSTEFFGYFTGLVFVGYGSEEIFPSIRSLKISLVVGERLRYEQEKQRTVSIGDDTHSAICPFAQTDVIDTILKGIDPSLADIYLSTFSQFVHKYNQLLVGICQDPPEMSKLLNQIDIDKVAGRFAQEMEEYQQRDFIRPLTNAVSTLSKEDLAEMAESLIYLTYLKRRITFAEESVGGPVDVAIISKVDGFIWIKRKQYFKPELNPHFFAQYHKP